MRQRAIITQLDAEKMKEAAALLAPEVRTAHEEFFQPVIDKIEAQAKLSRRLPRSRPRYHGSDSRSTTSTQASRCRRSAASMWCSTSGQLVRVVYQGLPEMKTYYEKYKASLRSGIDCNDPENNWKEAVQKHELPGSTSTTPRAAPC
jgi:hypothetical protein